MAHRLRALFLSLITMAVVAGCTEVPVAQDLSQDQALEIVAALSDHGISAKAERVKGSKPTFSVLLDSQDYSSAVQVMRAEQLPREQRPTMRELLTPSGLLPLSRELEMVKVDRAAAAEIEELLLAHSGIDEAKVVVRAASVAGSDQPRSVSVVLSSREAVEEEAIRALATRVVAGVAPEHVSVMIRPTRHSAVGVSPIGVPPGERMSASSGTSLSKDAASREMVSFLFFWRVPKSDVVSLTAAICGLVALVGVFAALLGFVSGSSRAAAQPHPDDDTGSQLRLDGGEQSAVRSGRFLVGGPTSGSGSAVSSSSQTTLRTGADGSARPDRPGGISSGTTGGLGAPSVSTGAAVLSGAGRVDSSEYLVPGGDTSAGDASARNVKPSEIQDGGGGEGGGRV